MLILFVFAGSFGEPGVEHGFKSGVAEHADFYLRGREVSIFATYRFKQGVSWSLVLRVASFELLSLSRLQRQQQQQQQQQKQQLLGRGHHRLHRCHRLHCLHHLRVQAGGLRVAGGAVAELRVVSFSRRM